MKVHYMLCLLLFFSCKISSSEKKESVEDIRIKDTIILNSEGDTSYMVQIDKKLNIYINNLNGKIESISLNWDSSSMLNNSFNYRRDNRGIEILLDNDKVRSINQRYLYNEKKIYLFMDSSGLPNEIEVWNDDNFGKVLEFKDWKDSVRFFNIDVNREKTDTILFLKKY